MKYTTPSRFTMPHQEPIEHFYVHIPFCHRICPYCSFYKHTPGATDQRGFVETLGRELERKAGEFPLAPKTLYLGGGTPSMLSPSLLELLFERLNQFLPLTQLRELTFEANPATFTQGKAIHFKALGITRVSLGIQSWDPEILATLGREHSPDQALESFELLREAGIPEINIDLMFSIPGQSYNSWKNSLQRTLELKPDHISAYNLTYEEDTAFFDQLKRGRFHEDPEADASFFELAHESLTEASYLHYETSNFAMPGKQSQHNHAYWAGKDYLGLGPGAVSTVHGKRWKNVPDTAKYIHLIQSRGRAEADIEYISPEAWQTERIALLLRTDQGVPEEFLPHSKRIEDLEQDALITRKQGHILCTQRGAMLVDSLIEHLLT